MRARSACCGWRLTGGGEKIIAVPSPKLTQRYLHVGNYTDLPQIGRGPADDFRSDRARAASDG